MKRRFKMKAISVLFVFIMMLSAVLPFIERTKSVVTADVTSKKILNKKTAKEEKSVKQKKATANSIDTQKWTSAGSSVCAWFNENKSKDWMGVNTNPNIMRVGKSAAGKEFFSFIRLPMSGSFLSNEIKNARLYLKIVKGKAPSSLRIGLLKKYWNNGITDLANAKKMFNKRKTVSVSVRKEKNKWISIGITKYVKKWLSGNIQNNGLVLLGKKKGERISFASDWDESSKNPPRLEVAGKVGNRNLSYGKFAYIRHPLKKKDDAKLENHETANCLSYALRDTNVIGSAELKLDYKAMTDLYRKSGKKSVYDYCIKMVMEYVERNKEELKISGFRQIDDFDSEIDASKEYRMAFRLYCNLERKKDVFDDVLGNFDYHVWAQINTGQWAQKFMFTPTEIIPYTPPGVSPGKFPWDYLPWSETKYHARFTDKVFYFAVTKDVDGFTSHKSK
ncbi:MAG: DNRLRE domain-containing protein [Lachnoclostridium sp.]|jgi:hypothetical protein|nr:DNRLRE domain-containing protein [Lachnoclostridium sp.]